MRHSFLIGLVMLFALPASVLHGGWFSTAVADPCKYRNIKDVPTAPRLEDVFSHDKKAQKNFTAVYFHQKNVELGLKLWLMSTETFATAKSIDDLELKIGTTAGQNNEGIYHVTLKQQPEKRYIIKMSTKPEEPAHLWKVQNSIAAHPECFLRNDLGLKRIATQQELALFPKLVRIHEAACVANAEDETDVRDDDDEIEESDSERCWITLILMDEAQGESLGSLLKSQTFEKYRQALYDAAKSLGYFHLFMAADSTLTFSNWSSWGHRDLHDDNVVYDGRQITFIDNGNMSGPRKFGRFFEDVLVLASVDQNFDAPLLDYLDAVKRKLNDAGTNSDDAFIEALKNPLPAIEYLKSETERQLRTQFDIFKTVALGYMSAMPVERKQELNKKFWLKCTAMKNDFITVALPRLSAKSIYRTPQMIEKVIRPLLAPGFIDCAEKGIL